MDKIEEILFKGTKMLRPIWKAKEYIIHHVNTNGESILPDTIVTYDSIYQLPIPEAKEGTKFTGWKLKSEMINTSEISIDMEGDITLVAVFEEAETVETELLEVTTEKVNSSKNNNGYVIIFILIAISVVLIIVFTAINKRKKSADLEYTTLMQNNTSDELDDETILVSQRGENDDEAMDEK